MGMPHAVNATHPHPQWRRSQGVRAQYSQPYANPRAAYPSDTQTYNEDGGGRLRKRPPIFWGFVGIVGELLITAGLIVGLFAFWQVYVTDWQVAKDEKVALAKFEKKYGNGPTNVSKDIRKDPPPQVASSAYGATFATLHIPSWNKMVVPVKEGTAQRILDLGVAGHYEQTAMPGGLGNFSVAAHRRSYGSNFRDIDKLREGNNIIVRTPDAWLVYKVVSHDLVLPEKVSVIAPDPFDQNPEPTRRLMTLTSCATSTGGQWGNTHRYIVHLELDHWVPRSSGIPAELTGGV
ncbi:MAG: class E sortase [Actinomycetaceae bacterium]|nr:class E sortase [Actinomycetaceae bacterium]